MGKRKKSSKPLAKKKQDPLPTIFQCLFCNHEKSVTVKIDKKQNIGSLQCKVCGQTYQTTTNYLSAPVDVYYDWVDACDAVEKEHGEGAVPASKAPPGAAASGRVAGGAAAEEDDEDDGFIVDDEMDGEGGFGED